MSEPRPAPEADLRQRPRDRRRAVGIVAQYIYELASDLAGSGTDP